MDEEIRPVPGYPGYNATSWGNAVSKKNKYIGRVHGNYVLVGPGVKRAKMVLLAFVGPPPPGIKGIEHINGNLLDDRPENLRWQ